MDVLQRDLWGCVGRGPGREGQRGVCSPTDPVGSALSVARRRSRGVWGGTETPQHVSGRPRGARRAPWRTPEVSPLSLGAGQPPPFGSVIFLCDRSSAGSGCQQTDLSACATYQGNYFGESVPNVPRGGRAHRLLARLCVAQARAG